MPATAASLTDAQRAFLAAPRFASFATLDPDGAPRQAVAWYDLLPDGRLLINSRDGRRWPANLRRDPRVAISIIEPGDGNVWLGLTAVVEEVVEDVERAREDIVALAHRYQPEGPSEASIAGFRSQPRITFLLRIERVHDHLDGD
jgi:PPOX class probable F420-dependent enzyme